MSKGLRDSSYKGIGEGLKGKKLSKVTVAAPDEETLEKGLTMAQKLIKAKFGEKGLSEDEMEEEVEHEDCPICEGEGCEECSLEELEDEETMEEAIEE